MNKEKLWTRDFLTVSAINSMLTLVFYLLVVIIGEYAMNALGASTSMSGLVTGIFIIGTLIGRLFIGSVIDSFGRKKTLMIGLVLFILTSLLYFLEISVGFLIFTRFIHGIALGIASTATGTIVAQIIPATRKAEGIGYYSMSTTLSTAIGPFIGLFMMRISTFRMIFIFCLVLAAAAFVLGLLLRVPAAKTAGSKHAFKLSHFIEPKAVPIAIVTLLISFCYSSVLSYINSYAKEIDLVEAASFFFIVYSAAILVSRPFTGRLLDVKGANIVMYPAFLIFAVGMLILSAASSGFILLLAGLLIGLGFGNMQSSTQAVAVSLAEPHRIGLATSTFFIALDAGLGLGPYILGYIIPTTGYSKLYVILSVLVLVSGVIYFFLHGKKDRTLRQEKEIA